PRTPHLLERRTPAGRRRRAGPLAPARSRRRRRALRRDGPHHADQRHPAGDHAPGGSPAAPRRPAARGIVALRGPKSVTRGEERMRSSPLSSGPPMRAIALMTRIAETDTTFEFDGERWHGKCLICNGRLSFDVRTGFGANVEHILPRSLGGDNTL